MNRLKPIVRFAAVSALVLMSMPGTVCAVGATTDTDVSAAMPPMRDQTHNSLDVGLMRHISTGTLVILAYIAPQVVYPVVHEAIEAQRRVDHPSPSTPTP